MLRPHGSKRSGLRAAVAACILLAACGGSGDAADQENDYANEQIDLAVTTTLDGDLSGTVTAQGKVNYVRSRPGTKELADQSIMGWELFEPLVAGGKAVRLAVTITPFRGDGTYRIDKGSKRDLQQEGASKQVKSTVQVHWWPDGNTATGVAETFERRAEQCTVKVEDLGMRGTLRCPRLVSDTDKSARVELEWRRA